MFDQVRADVINTKKILQPGGIAVFDDYRMEHTPGVAAAVWESVFFDGLVPFAVTARKMYAVYEGADPEPYREALKEFVARDRSTWWMQEQYVLGRPLLRIKNHQRSVNGPAHHDGTNTPARAKPIMGANRIVEEPRPTSGMPTAPARSRLSKRPVVGRVAARSCRYRSSAGCGRSALPLGNAAGRTGFWNTATLSPQDAAINLEPEPTTILGIDERPRRRPAAVCGRGPRLPSGSGQGGVGDLRASF